MSSNPNLVRGKGKRNGKRNGNGKPQVLGKFHIFEKTEKSIYYKLHYLFYEGCAN